MKTATARDWNISNKSIPTSNHGIITLILTARSYIGSMNKKIYNQYTLSHRVTPMRF